DTTHPVSPTVAGYPVSRATPSSSLRFFQISILPDGSLHLHDPANVLTDQSQWSFQTSGAPVCCGPLKESGVRLAFAAAREPASRTVRLLSDSAEGEIL